MLHKLFNQPSANSKEMASVVVEDTEKTLQHHISSLKNAIETFRSWVRNHHIYRDPGLQMYGPNENLSFSDVQELIEDTRARIKIIEKIINNQPISREEKDSLIAVPELKNDEIISRYPTKNDSSCRLS